MWLRVSGLVLRYLYLYRRSLARAGEIVFWPVMELLVWGFLTTYLDELSPGRPMVYLLGGLIFWDVLYRSQQAITLAVTEEIWVKNLLNIFLAPVSIFELMLATCIMGIIKSMITGVILSALALFCYSFNIINIGWQLIPFLICLLLFGWAMGMCTMALVLRFGQAAEALVWGVPFLIQPISAVFYPVSVLPPWLQVIAKMLPSTYVFEGMREALNTGRVDMSLLGLALLLNAVYLAAAAAYFAWMFSRVREKGYLTRLGME